MRAAIVMSISAEPAKNAAISPWKIRKARLRAFIGASPNAEYPK
jgi:hypothetical protein